MNKKTLEDTVKEDFNSLHYSIHYLYDNNDIRKAMKCVSDILNKMYIKIEELEEELKEERLKNNSPNPQYFKNE